MTPATSALTRALAVLAIAAAAAGCTSPGGAGGTTASAGTSATATETGASTATSDATPTNAASEATFTYDASGAVETLSYPGRTGATALDLLLEADPDAQVQGAGENAFVTGIGGRLADSAKNEFWLLEVDGEMAQLGAGSLQTTDGETITWSIDTF